MESNPKPALIAVSAGEGTDPRPAFPVHVLGSRLSQAALAVAHRTQAPVELAAHDVLTLAAMAAQRLIGVRLPTGEERPVSCFFASLIDHEDGRRAVEKALIDPARLWERAFEDEFPRRVAAHVDEGVETGVQRAQPVRRLNLFYDTRAPQAGNRYHGFVRQSGLFAAHPHDFVQPGPSRRGEAFALCRIWTGAVIKPAVGPVFFPRLSLHVAASLRAGAALLNDAEIAESGLSARLLLAAPPSRLGRRIFTEADGGALPGEAAEMLAYLGALFEKPATADSRIIVFSKDAAAAWLSFARETESALAPAGPFAPIAGFASVLAEHAARLAAVIAFMEDCTLEEIDAAQLARGIALARFYAEERLSLQNSAAFALSEEEKEQILQDWLQRTKTETKVTLRDICRAGPKATRNADIAYKIMRRMERLGIVQPANEAFQGAAAPRRPRVTYAWRVEKDAGQDVA
ncbi:MAG: DUF3987 domain-containing protein [Rhodospirillaceae bacterium]